MQKITIDAKGRTIGRVASEAAQHLMGKTSPAYERNQVANVSVHVVNVGALQIPLAREKKVYTRYSGHPGGLKHETLSHVVGKKGRKEVIWRAVYGMLPSNKLRTPRIKRLVITE